MTTYYQLHDSPTGELLLLSNGCALTALHMTAGKYVPAMNDDWVRDERLSVLIQTKRELDAYFLGKLRTFTMPLAPLGTDFQKRAWIALTKIPYGETRSYEQLAIAVGDKKAVRAVGRTNGLNRIAIVIPCHRVVNKSGALGGYGGGLRRKQFLLDLERSAQPT